MTNIARNTALRGALALLLTGTAAMAVAQSPLTDFAGRDPGVQDIIRALKPADAQQAPAVRTRAIRFPGQQTAAVAPEPAGDAAPATSPEAPPRKASFDQIQFRFDSADLTPAARRMLDRIGEALSSDDLKGLRFVIEGHTDATGPDQYNRTLSQRRAEAVHRYLTARFGIQGDALAAVGKGEEELLDPRSPASAVNRRVVIGTLDH